VNWQTPWTSYPVGDCLTFQDVSTQVNDIAKGIAQLTEHVNRCVEWWGRMRAGLKSLKDELPKVMQDGHQSSQSLTGDVADGWIDVADQFALCVYKTSPVIADYIHPVRGMPIIPPQPQQWTHSPRIDCPPSPAICATKPPQAEEPMSFWKRLSCVS